MAHENDSIIYEGANNSLFDWACGCCQTALQTKRDPAREIFQSLIGSNPNEKRWALEVDDGLVSWIEVYMRASVDRKRTSYLTVIGSTEFPDTGMGQADVYWRVNSQINAIKQNMMDNPDLTVSVQRDVDSTRSFLVTERHGPGSVDIYFGPDSFESALEDEQVKSPSMRVALYDIDMPGNQTNFDHIMNFWATAYSAFLGSLYEMQGKELFSQQLVVKLD